MGKKSSIEVARKLRSNSTDAEMALWRVLRARQIEGVKFRRQQAIGHFIVDFVSFEKRIAIEIDGGQHVQDRNRDLIRDQILGENGFTVLRFWNNEVLEDLDGVLEVIRMTCLE